MIFRCILLLLVTSNFVQAADRNKAWFTSDEGRTHMANVLSWQSEHGDWPKNQSTSKTPYTGDRAKITGTFDNGATTDELRLLAEAYVATQCARYSEAFLIGFDHILAAQYANGGWPQYFPLRKGYYSHITFNDGSMTRLLEFLRDTADAEQYPMLDSNRRTAAEEAVQLGVECILNCQVVVDGVPTVWCAQHDEETLAPAKARSYELPSLSGSESAGVMKFLMSIEAPSPAVIRSVDGAAVWFAANGIEGFRYRRSKDPKNLFADDSARTLWARFNELDTNRPFFCDRDGIVKYRLDEIGSERRGGYAWYGTWGQSALNMHRKWKKRLAGN